MGGSVLGRIVEGQGMLGAQEVEEQDQSVNVMLRSGKNKGEAQGFVIVVIIFSSLAFLSLDRAIFLPFYLSCLHSHWHHWCCHHFCWSVFPPPPCSLALSLPALWFVTLFLGMFTVLLTPEDIKMCLELAGLLRCLSGTIVRGMSETISCGGTGPSGCHA